MKEAILVFITTGSQEEADTLSSALLEERLVACVNQVKDIASFYWWQGERDQAIEVLLLAKTRRELWAQVLDAIRKHHSYEVFEAIAVPLIEANPAYLDWIWESTREP